MSFLSPGDGLARDQGARGRARDCSWRAFGARLARGPAGSELQRPLALAVIGGLALSTPVTLYIVPTLLVQIRGRGWAFPSE